MKDWPTLRPEAEADLEVAYDWYEERRGGLGAEFVAEVDGCLERIAEGPRKYQPVYRKIRRALTRRFPYAIFFITEADAIEVLAVLHQAQHPRRLLERAQGG